MRPIPLDIRQKLLNRIKAESTDSLPTIRLIATQTATNTLLSEPIHENVASAFGDVTIRQTYGDADPALAYAICLDAGIATVRRRSFPANADYPWIQEFVLGAATDVAIEFDGVWEMDASDQWYILRTQQFPYIFFVQDGNLYVQYWNDVTTRALLAENVSQISACRGWQNSIDKTLDQGLIIGYLRAGEVYYRSLCYQADESYAWETERKITSLGTGNTTLSLFRTNDFRVGFLTENGGNIKLALTSRNYAGMSVRPETMHAAMTASFGFQSVHRIQSFLDESMQAATSASYFNFLPSNDTTPEIAVSGTGRIQSQTPLYTSGCKIYLDKPVFGTVPAAFSSACTVTVSGSGTVVPLSSVAYDAGQQAIIIMFSTDVRQTLELTVTTPICGTAWYYRVGSQKWYLRGLSVSVPALTNNIYAFEQESVSVSMAPVQFTFFSPQRKYGLLSDAMTAAMTASFTLTPVSTKPI